MAKFCTSCGTALEEGQRFCGKCGAPVKAGTTARAGTAAQGSGTAGARVNTPAQTGVPVAANSGLLVLGILLGWLGIHCFSTGKKKRGILELALWLASVASLITGLAFRQSIMNIYKNGAFAQAYSGDDYAMRRALRWAQWDFFNFSAWGGDQVVFVAILAAALLFFVFFLICWIRDIINITKGVFTGMGDTVPGFINGAATFINTGLPEWKFTKKHLVFIALLAGLQIVVTLLAKTPLSRIPLLSSILRSPLALCGVFFGPLAGTVIAGLRGVISSLVQFHFDIRSVLSFCIPAFVSGYIVYGVPKIRALGNKFAGNKLLQGLLIGIAVLVGQFLSFAIVNYRGFFQVFFQSFQHTILSDAIASVVGVLLPLALAKKGVLLGPFVKREESAVGENR